MRVTLLGTGSAEGWPSPFCGCASCATARADGVVRAPTCALVDDVLLLDYGAETPRQAERCAHPLTGLRAVLVTHADADRFDPAFLPRREHAAAGEPLQVLGPPGAVDACARRLPPGSAVSLTPLAAGQVVHVDGYRVQALATPGEAPDGSLLYDVTAPDGDRLLYAVGSRPLSAEDVPASGDGPAYSVVLLEETLGDRAADNTGKNAGHLDLATFPLTLARLRAAGAVTGDTDVVAVHLSHLNPPQAELARRLRAYGARVLPDGATVGADPPVRRAAAPRRTLVTGGARSGKSREAERMLLAEPEVVYVATGTGGGDDPAWRERVAAHRARRPDHWCTVETLDLMPLLAEPGPPLLVDCLTLWLAGVLDRLGAWSEDADAARVDKEVTAEVDALARAWRATPRRVVAVTNEVGSGVVPGTVAGGRFRDLLGRVNATVAAESEQVLLCVAGRVVTL
jgi:adenosylcobinamide kinase / adenosylcobinamide-phosphate guanylyltransferase